MLNLFLLSHKCGNNYFQHVHRKARSVQSGSVTPGQGKTLIERQDAGDIFNARCRNYNAQVLASQGLLKHEANRFLVFIRHPASFVLSATKYHLRGDEGWAATVPQKHLGGVPLTTALRAADSESERQVITMTHFHKIIENQVSLKALAETDSRFMVVRCEELFSSTSEEYYRVLAAFLRLGDNKEFLSALMKSSPAFMEKLPGHATGEFRKADPASLLEGQAQDHYRERFLPHAEQLGYA